MEHGAGRQLVTALSASPAPQAACGGAARIGQTPGACARVALLAVRRVLGDRQPGMGDVGDYFGGLGVGVIEPGPGVFEAFARHVGDGEPIVLINLLRYRQRADTPGEQLTGRQAYQRYARAVGPMLMAVGARPIWRGKGRFVVIGPAGERWDEIILVAYPSRGAFERLVNLPGFRACAGLRSAALEDSRLIAASAPQRIGRVSWRLYSLVARLRRRAVLPSGTWPEPLTAASCAARAGTNAPRLHTALTVPVDSPSAHRRQRGCGRLRR